MSGRLDALDSFKLNGLVILLSLYQRDYLSLHIEKKHVNPHVIKMVFILVRGG